METDSSTKIPDENIIKQLETTNAAISQLEEVLKEFSAKSPLTDTSRKSTPLQIAELRLVLAQTAMKLFHLLLQSKGIDPVDHDVKKEENKLKQYEKKVRKARVEYELSLSKRSLTVDASTLHQFIAAAAEPNLNEDLKINAS